MYIHAGKKSSQSRLSILHLCKVQTYLHLKCTNDRGTVKGLQSELFIWNFLLLYGNSYIRKRLWACGCFLLYRVHTAVDCTWIFCFSFSLYFWNFCVSICVKNVEGGQLVLVGKYSKWQVVINSRWYIPWIRMTLHTERIGFSIVLYKTSSSMHSVLAAEYARP